MYSFGPINLYEQGTSTPTPTPWFGDNTSNNISTVAQEVAYIPAYTLGQMPNNFFIFSTATVKASCLFPF